jgi:hypothetical protein
LTGVKEKIENDVFIINKFLSPFAKKEDVVEKIRKVHIPRYLERYALKVHLFNSNGDPIQNKNDAHLDEWKIKYLNQSNKLPGQGLYKIFYDANRYLLLVDLERSGYKVGYILLDLRKRKVLHEAVYPDLLTDESLSSIATENFDYAILKDRALNVRTGSIDWETIMSSMDLFKTNNYDQIEYFGKRISVHESGNKTVLVARDDFNFLRLLKNISFLFFLFLFVIVTLLGAYALRLINKRKILTLTTKIQLSLNLAFFFPLIAVSLGVYNQIKKESKNQIHAEYRNTSQNISNLITNELGRYYQNEISFDELNSLLSEISDITNQDINLFDINGELIISSQPDIFELRILPEQLNPRGYQAIIERAITRPFIIR